jgi:hypothetical protein
MFNRINKLSNLIFCSNKDNLNKNNSEETMTYFFDKIQENPKEAYSEINED